MNTTGTLYLVGTPIGNLDDMTFRAVETLKRADLIAAEDTRHTRKLLAHFDIHVALTSYHEHNKAMKGPQLIEKLLAGLNIAAVSDAGLPGIADPGSDLAVLAVDNNIEVVPVPGPNAALTALIASGLNTVRFSFIGFLPKKAGQRKAVLESIKNREDTLIFYETPHRLINILKEMENIFGGERRITVCRELTKKFEQFIRGTVKEINAYFSVNEPRGEFVLIIEGNSCKDAATKAVSPEKYVLQLIKEGISKKDAIRQAAKQLHLSRRDIYQMMLTQEGKI